MVAALIKFAQGASTPPAGQALVGVLSTTVAVSNGTPSGVVRSTFTWLDTPPTSSIPIGVAQDGPTPTYSFAPDVPGSFLLQLTVYDSSGNIAIDKRTFGVRQASNHGLIPPFGGDAGSMNFSGQLEGWAPTIREWLLFLDTLAVATSTPVTWRPGTATSGTTFATFAEVTAFLSGYEAATIFVDAEHGALTIPAGTYPLPKFTEIVSSGPNVQIALANGVILQPGASTSGTLSPVLSLRNVGLLGQNTAIANITTTGAGQALKIVVRGENGTNATSIQTNASFPLVEGTVDIELLGLCAITKLGTAPVVHTGSSFNATVGVRGGSFLGAGAMVADTPANLIVAVEVTSGPGFDPSYTSNSLLLLAHPTIDNPNVKTATTFNVSLGNFLYVADTTSNAVTGTMPTPTMIGERYRFLWRAGSNAFSMSGGSNTIQDPETLGSNSTYGAAQGLRVGMSFELQWNGTTWQQV